MSEALSSANGFKRSADHQAGSDLVGIVAEPVLEEFGVGENHPELVIQAVEKSRDLRLACLGGRPSGGGSVRRHG